MSINIIKKCRICQQEKPLIDFSPDGSSKDKYRNDCKKCNCDARKKWQRENLDKVLEKNRKWRANNKEHVIKYRETNLEKTREQARVRYKTNENVRLKRIQSAKKYRDNPLNKPIIRATQKKLRDKYSKNPIWKLKYNMRRRLLFVLNGHRKSDTTKKLVGCSWEYLKEHLQSQFKDGMTWENYGLHGWHVDHIKPCNSFDFSNPEEQSRCFHYTNLQPLWAKDNLSKGDKF